MVKHYLVIHLRIIFLYILDIYLYISLVYLHILLTFEGFPSQHHK